MMLDKSMECQVKFSMFKYYINKVTSVWSRFQNSQVHEVQECSPQGTSSRLMRMQQSWMMGGLQHFIIFWRSPYLSKRADNTGVLKWCIDGWFVAHPNVRQGWKDKKYELYDCQFVLIRVDVLIPSILWT